MHADTIAHARRSRIRKRGWLAKAAEEGRDTLYEQWRELCPQVPAPSVLAAARHEGSEALCQRLIRRLAWERKLRAYAKGGNFPRLVRLYAQAELLRREGAA